MSALGGLEEEEVEEEEKVMLGVTLPRAGSKARDRLLEASKWRPLAESDSGDVRNY